MSDKRTNLLHISIVKNQKICKFSKISFQTLDKPLGQGYIVSMSDIRTNTKNGNGATESRKGSTGAKGEFYERTEKFSGMA